MAGTPLLADSTEFVDVADAIRAKSGTSASLAWPDDFVAAIGSIQSGWSDSAKMTNMRYMFSESPATSIDLTGLDTSNVTNMSYAFYLCANLTSLDLTGFDTSNVEDMQDLFRGCTNLVTIDLPTNIDTSKVTNMRYFLYGCASLTGFDFSGFDFSNVENLGYFMTFSSATAGEMESIDLSGKTFGATDATYMFRNRTGLKTVDFTGSRFTADSVATTSMFLNSGVETLTLPTMKLGTCQSMFQNCASLEELDLSNVIVADTTNTRANFLAGATALKKLVTGVGWAIPSTSSYRAKFPVRMANENGAIYAANAAIPVGAHTYTAA